jgi:hypothetical protein
MRLYVARSICRLLLIATAAWHDEVAPAVGPCPALPQIQNVCLGISEDSLRKLRPNLFDDSGGPQEMDGSGFTIGYYWRTGGTFGVSRLTAIRVELDSLVAHPLARDTLIKALSAGVSAPEFGTVRAYDPWLADSVDVPAVRWFGNGAARLLRLDSDTKTLSGRRSKLFVFDTTFPPKHVGRWIDCCSQ